MNIGLTSGCQMQNFIPFSKCVTIAVISVSAPVPAVVGTVIIFGNAFSFVIFGTGCSNSKSHNGVSLLTVKHIDLPPSIALPPQIAMIES